MSDKTELQLLKERAGKLGISYSPNIGLDKLKDKVNKVLTDTTEDPITDDVVEVEQPKLTARQKMAIKRKEQSALVRCRITCMNPNKKESEGEVFAVGNQYFSFKKYVLFNNEYHLPKMILDAVKEKECQIFYHTKDEKGRKTMKAKTIKEFGVEVLPDLTEEELKELAQRQAATGAVDN